MRQLRVSGTSAPVRIVATSVLEPEQGEEKRMDSIEPHTQNERPSAILLDVGQVADMLACSARTVYRLADAGRMPRPVKIGRLVRWRQKELEDWVEEGCPRIRSLRR
jgi:excisionase family DNA binding protein